MNLLRFLTRAIRTWRAKRTSSDAARELSLEGHRQRHDRIIARTRQLRREIGMAPSPALERAR
jgi:hypothetical protein